MELAELFGSKVFNDTAMRTRLPVAVYKSLKHSRQLGLPLDPEIADAVASAMLDWALEQNATHYSHWFQPMNNVTAGKHDSFITPNDDGGISLEFTSKALIKGEPDASSFPSGGLRATFEARGYTAWDPTSPAFVRDSTLYIPTCFCSYTGEALDTKTPLLRSMQTVSKEGIRLLRLLGNTTSTSLIPTVGAEQEYFLIDRDMYEKRLDLKLCGRTLFGSKPPKGQELDDHYCGRIRLRVAAFMEDLDRELWSLGISSKTKHNEAAPAQHELAPVYDDANIACDHNQLTMEMMRVVAKKHHLACLLHEKPFQGINGSGKHNNYSLCTDDGINLLSPGKNPEENLLFMLMLCAFIQSVDKYGDLLRMSASCAGNDYRLGACEAPPPIISVFLGSALTQALLRVAAGTVSDNKWEHLVLDTGVVALPTLTKDDSDRNRTSPFAFTGNKFEFRMVGSSQSIAYSNIVLNTILAEAFLEFSDRLEKADNREMEVKKIISDVVLHHSRIIFNGNNYSSEWVAEAKRRGLPILENSLEGYKTLTDPKNIALFSRFGVFSSTECRSRYEIMLDNTIHTLTIEAATLLEIVKRQIIPTSIKYAGKIACSSNEIAKAGIQSTLIQSHVGRITDLIEQIVQSSRVLEETMEKASAITELEEHAQFMYTHVNPVMSTLRGYCDTMESFSDSYTWPVPTYTDLLHRI